MEVDGLNEVVVKRYNVAVKKNEVGMVAGDRECSHCVRRGVKMSMVKVAEVEKVYGGKRYTFDGYVCMKCGHMDAIMR